MRLVHAPKPSRSKIHAKTKRGLLLWPLRVIKELAIQDYTPFAFAKPLTSTVHTTLPLSCLPEVHVAWTEKISTWKRARQAVG